MSARKIMVEVEGAWLRVRDWQGGAHQAEKRILAAIDGAAE